MKQLKVTSAAFEDNGTIPPKFTADGANVSPPLAWSNVPPEARSLALVLEDPDAPRTQPWVHWIIYGIPTGVGGLPEGVPAQERLNEPIKAVQGLNTWGNVGYGGPEPPKGHGTHHYHFRLYALDERLDAAPGMTPEALLQAIKPHVIATGEVVGTYER